MRRILTLALLVFSLAACALPAFPQAPTAVEDYTNGSRQQVTATTAHPTSQTVSVTLVDPRTRLSQTITCTPNHPFYVQSEGFVPAGQLGVGTSIVTRAGPCLTVSAARLLPQQVGGYLVYNLTVEGDHTYFVGSVDGGAWVHNTCRTSSVAPD